MTDDRNQRIARALGFRCISGLWFDADERIHILPHFDSPEGLALGKAECVKREWDFGTRYQDGRWDAWVVSLRYCDRVGDSEAAAFWDAFLAAVEASEEGTE